MVQLYQHKNEITEAGIQVLAVSFETIKSAKVYLKDTELEWPIILDEQRELYHFFGMGEAGFWDIWGYRTWIAYFRELINGRGFRKGEGDINQRGGDVLIDPEGLVRFHHIGKGPGDRPEISSLLQLVKR